MIDIPRPLFPLGRVVGTPAAVKALQAVGTEPSELLDRHVIGDFGNDRFERQAWLTFCSLQARGLETV